MKLTLAFFLLLSIGVKGQTPPAMNTNCFDYSKDSVPLIIYGGGWTSQSQTNGYSTVFATRNNCDTCHWIIVQPDSLMAYYQRESEQAEINYAKLYRAYNELLRAYKKQYKAVQQYLKETSEDRKKMIETIRSRKYEKSNP